MSQTPKRILIITLALVMLVFVGTAIAETEQPVEITADLVVENPPTTTTTVPLDPRQRLVPREHALPSEAFWDRLAYCETRNDRTHPNGNWQNGGRFAGGLGIMNSGTFADVAIGKGQGIGTWERWGGEEFAPSPDKATREEQIIVANRIAVLGWETVVIRDADSARRKGVPVEYHYKKPPVGFGGWGALPCAGGTPPLFWFEDTSEIPTMTFSFHEKSKFVHDLQGILDIKQTGKYDSTTRYHHLKWLKSQGLSTTGVPALP